jgi:antimicrobial peptide system SdpA family protein
MRLNWRALRAVGRPRPGAIHAITDRQLGRAVLGLAAVAVTVAGLAVYPALPPNAIQIPQGVTQAARLLVPEGWAFFTASPRTVYPQAYELSRRGTWRDQGGSLAVPSDLFGLDRSLRAEGTEIALLVQSVPARAWRDCGSVPARCLSAAPVAVRLVNTSTLDNLCGDVGFVRQQVLPWAWRDSGTVMPSLVLRAEVSC